MAVTAEGIDWLKWMRIHGQTSPEVFDGRLDEDWIREYCLLAAEKAQQECPAVKPRLRSGALSERMYAAVICESVLRVARWTLLKSENDGSYNYSNDTPVRTPNGEDMSPNIWFSASQQRALEGTTSRGLAGTIHMGLSRVYGM
ncbi:hypothetical protein [Bifidobacterium tissieri]|uniref:Uncharacterized protein n=1 Tax=Bifidobacterium tissieri TaxID=1630162 RepID=A0A5M9ZVJ1_9BIFI|nr:hypothetical protein [Bifidobacterium tissieri]KAA8829334.1 hypothetical protein EM849_11040 [Bifidobacterium tissieri]KAA8831647.1 hypothetical protein EMO89_02680 [Bifidobacterium tissieri]